MEKIREIGWELQKGGKSVFKSDGLGLLDYDRAEVAAIWKGKLDGDLKVIF